MVLYVTYDSACQALATTVVQNKKNLVAATDNALITLNSSFSDVIISAVLYTLPVEYSSEWFWIPGLSR